MAPGALAQVLSDLPNTFNPRLLIGFDSSDDACVYKVSDDTALISTVDFFPPMVDDPYLFGQIAAANALSDVYAMGGTPTLAMNLLCFPNCLDVSVAEEILRGGADKAKEAGCTIAGGHTITDDEPKYGMCVMGFARPDEVLANGGARPGDALVLTKRVGSGLLNTAVKGELLEQSELGDLYREMSTLNKYAAEVARDFDVHGCTDVTGFGLAGHLCEMAEGAGVTVRLSYSAVPLFDSAADMARMGIVPGGAYRNEDYFGDRVKVDEGLAEEVPEVVFDPQSSGGLMFALPPEQADELVARIRATGVSAARVGEFVARGEGEPFVRVVA
ncbi:selenide, water dikinase [Olsenella sp. DNF00959]|nr:selenide, water dikinase [Olsenella sp. DNF00959]